MHSSVISAQLATQHLSSSGLLVLPGAAAAAEGPTSGMIGYGAAKAAVHHILRSVAEEDSGLPKGACALCVLPTCLTEMNRKFMPDADHSSWTRLGFVAELLYRWASDPACRPSSGALVRMNTAGGVTSLVSVQHTVSNINVPLPSGWDGR